MRAVAISSIVVLVAAATLSAQARPDFSGRWTLVPDSVQTAGGGRGDMTGRATGGGGQLGGGTGLGPPPEVMVIRQDAKMLVIEEHREGMRPVVIAVTLDGKKSKNEMALGRGRFAEAEYYAKWDRAKLITTIRRKVEALAGGGRQTMTLETRETRSLQPDGAMAVDVTVAGRRAGRKALYRKAEQ